MKKLTNAKDLIENLKTTDIETYNEIKENTANIAKKWGGKRINSGRKHTVGDKLLKFTKRLSDIEVKFIEYARAHKINYEDLMQGQHP